MKKLALLLLVLGWAAPAHATWVNTQHLSNIACGNVATCNVTGFSAVAAGSFIIGFPINEVAGVTATTGTSGGGTYVLPTGCTGTSSCAALGPTSNLGIAVQYVASSTGSPTTLSCTASAAVIDDCQINVYTFTAGPITMDKGASTARASGTNIAGVSAGTLTGTNDLIIQYGTFSGTASGCPNSAASPGDFPNGNASCGLINSTNVTAGNYTSTSSTGALGSIAFKEAAGTAKTNQVGAFLAGP